MGKYPGLDGTRVLIVEDDAFQAFDAAALLSREGVQVIGPTPTKAEAAKLFVETVFDAAILDVQLADGDCVELAHRLVQDGEPVIILTGYPLETLPIPDAVNCVQMLKPMDQFGLLSALEQLVLSSDRGQWARDLAPTSCADRLSA